MARKRTRTQTTIASGSPDEMAILQRKKLELEIDTLRSPFRRNPALWLTSATTLIAVAAFVVQLQLSKREFLVSQQHSLHATIQRDRTLLELEKKKDELNSVVREVAAAKQLHDSHFVEVQKLKHQRDHLIVENRALLAHAYQRSLTDELVPMPRTVAVRRIGKEIRPDGQELRLTLHPEPQAAYDGSMPYTASFQYVSDEGDVLTVSRDDYTDHISWSLRLTLAKRGDESEIVCQSEKGFSGALEYDFPFGGYPRIADPQDREILLAAY